MKRSREDIIAALRGTLERRDEILIATLVGEAKKAIASLQRYAVMDSTEILSSEERLSSGLLKNTNHCRAERSRSVKPARMTGFDSAHPDVDSF